MDPSPGELIAEAQAANPHVVVVAVAGHGDDDRILPALRGGAAGVVVKYDTPDVIAEQLRYAVAGVLPLTPALARQAIRHADSRGGSGAALTGSEWELLAWVAAGDTLSQAAQRTRQRPQEIEFHIDRIYQRMALRARARIDAQGERHVGTGADHE